MKQDFLHRQKNTNKEKTKKKLSPNFTENNMQELTTARNTIHGLSYKGGYSNSSQRSHPCEHTHTHTHTHTSQTASERVCLHSLLSHFLKQITNI